MTKVVLCICTCNRPGGLTQLLQSVADLDFQGELSVVVVENDSQRQGLAACNCLVDTYRWPLACVVEKQRGISFARNKAINLAIQSNPEFVAMLDDDEWVPSQWLKELLKVQLAKNADLVGGPSVPVFPEDCEKWSSLSEYYGYDLRIDDGDGCLLHSTSNFLARSVCFESLMPAPFDPLFAKSGGEDLVFFRSLAKKGCRMFWSTRGVAFEGIPHSRMTSQWLRQRQVRRGNLNVIVQRMFEPGLINEIFRLGKTTGLLLISVVFLSLAFPHPLMRMRATLLLRKAAGKIMGHLGLMYFEYGEAGDKKIQSVSH